METFRILLIHLVFPLIGLSVYLFLCRKMRDAKIEKPLIFHCFVCFSVMAAGYLFF